MITNSMKLRSAFDRKMADQEAAIIEAMAMAICETTGLKWADQANAQTSGGGSDCEQEGYRDQAKAALVAYRRVRGLIS